MKTLLAVVIATLFSTASDADDYREASGPHDVTTLFSNNPNDPVPLSECSRKSMAIHPDKCRDDDEIEAEAAKRRERALRELAFPPKERE